MPRPVTPFQTSHVPPQIAPGLPSAKDGRLDTQLLQAGLASRVTVRSGDVVLRVGDAIDKCFVVAHGWVGRERIDSAGRRDIVTLFLPGDIFGIHQSFRQTAIHDYRALSDGEIAVVQGSELRRLAAQSPTFAASLDWHQGRALNIAAEEYGPIARRNAEARILHRLLTIWSRLAAAGQARDDGFDCPIRQVDIADLVGLSSVTTSKAMAALRMRGLLGFGNGRVHFPDPEAAHRFADFDGRFLQPFDPIVSLAS